MSSNQVVIFPSSPLHLYSNLPTICPAIGAHSRTRDRLLPHNAGVVSCDKNAAPSPAWFCMSSDWIPIELLVVLESPIPRSFQSAWLRTHHVVWRRPSVSSPVKVHFVLLVRADFVSAGVGGIISHIATGAGPLSASRRAYELSPNLGGVEHSTGSLFSRYAQTWAYLSIPRIG